jgi:type IV pilus secretin PilQ/predicted competence protein
MKRKTFWLLLTTLSLLVFLAGYVQNSPSIVTINKIIVQPGSLNTQVILETDGPLASVKTYYAKDSAKTIVLELEKVDGANQPQIQLPDQKLVKAVDLQKAGADAARLYIRLNESVPYRVRTGQNQTVVELNRFLREKGDYLIEESAQRQLDSQGKASVFMNKVSVEDKEAELAFKAKLSQPAVSQVFTLENPLRLVVDVFNAVYEEAASVYPVNNFGLKKARVAQFQLGEPYAITRLVFDLNEPKPYDLRTENNELVVSFPKSPVPVVAAATASAPPPAVSSSPPPAVSSSAPAPVSPPKPVEKPKAEEPKPAAAPDVEASIKVPNGKNGKPQQTPEELYLGQETQEQRYEPKTIAQTEVKYTGEIITLKFKDADLRDVILYLGDFAKLNVVFDPEVRGTVTCNLEDVPWDQALDILLRNNKLGKVLEGNVLRIAPVSVLTREDEEQRKLRESKEQAGPLIVRTVTLSYSKARDVMSLLATKKSPRGEITIDERTNTLIISDVKENLDLLERLITVLDTPTPQVSIEARIVEATSTFIRNLGVQWGAGAVADPFYGNQTSLQFPNKILVDGALIPQGVVTKGIGGPLGGYAVNLPAPAFTTAIGFSFANVLDTFRLDMAISALETSGEGRIISSPKVTTQNNQEATIVQGRQIPVQTVANFTVTTRYVNAALELKATPQITAEGTIIMAIEIQNNAADFANLVNGIPPITTQSATTTVMVPDGGTTVIGGIYRTEDSITRERVPFLWSIPIIGNLFKSYARTKQNRELLIFITPRIIK